MGIRTNLWMILGFSLVVLGYSNVLAQLSPLPAQNVILVGLKKSHPRLIIPAGDFAAFKKKMLADTLMHRLYEGLKDRADAMLTATPSKYDIPDGLRLLTTSRNVVDRVYTLSMVYQMEGNVKYADRAWKELAAAAAFPDWNAQRHFLDVGEMCHAFAIGYDWLYDYLSPAQRQTMRTAMIEFAFKTGLESFQKKAFWVTAKHNWNMVCNGGLIMGALAIGDEEKVISDSLMHKALTSLTQSGSIQEFGPDGGWGEGPGYWGYAMEYLAVAMSGMNTALGTDFGISKIPGVSEAGYFPIYTNGPNNRSFNYADAHDSPGGGASMFYLAQIFNQPAFSGYEVQRSMSKTLDLVWYMPGKTAAASALPLDRHFIHAGAVSMRSAWEDPNAVSIQFKGGDNKFNHSHLDLGSFVLDANGVRWGGDLGSDNYNMPGYFDTAKKRWTYYRLRAEGQNTFILNPGLTPDQEIKAAAPITRFGASPEEVVAIADMTAAYVNHAQNVQRGVALTNNRQWVMVQDEMTATQPAEAWWFMHTGETLKVGADSLSATFESKNGQRLLARILSPAGAKFRTMKAEALPTSPVVPDSVKENPNTGVSKLAIHLSGQTNLRLTVVFVPLKPVQVAPTTWPKVVPLGATWPSGTVDIRPKMEARLPELASLQVQSGKLHIQVRSEIFFKATLVSLAGKRVAEFSGLGEGMSPPLKPGIYAVKVNSLGGNIQFPPSVQRALVLIP